MKKIIMVTFVGILLLMLCLSSYAHQGNLDKYGGHYIQENGYCIGYHYHEGSNKGYQLNLNPSIKWENRTILNKFKPFNPEKLSCIGEWIKVTFDEEGNVIIKSSTPKITPTQEVTATPATIAPATTAQVTDSQTMSPLDQLPQTGAEVPIISSIISMVMLAGGGFLLKKNYKNK